MTTDVTSNNAITISKITNSNGGSSGHSSNGSTSTAQTVQNTVEVEVSVNGKTEAAAVTTTKVSDKTVTTIAIDDKNVQEKLQQEGNNAVVAIHGNSTADVTIGQLNGQTVKNMESKDAVLEIKAGNVIYTLPASQINIDNISSQLGTQVDLKDVTVQVEISKSDNQAATLVENLAKQGSFLIVVPPVDFNVKCVYGNKTVAVNNFSKYVERLIEIPDGVDPAKITTGVIVDPDGTVRHVPTKIITVDGKYYAKINSLTNSSYSVIWNPKTFKDVEKHWAKSAVNDMGARLVISGVGKDMFEPDKDVTRAEFAAIIVRAMGLKPGIGDNQFKDVKSSDWYSGYVKTACDYKLISGYSADTFGPTDKISREQAMTIIAKAMDITGLKANESTNQMESFIDFVNAHAYAKTSINACISTGVVSGKGKSLIAPKDNITRAEVAAIIQRLLQKSGLI